MIVENYSDKYFDDVMKLVENFHAEAVSEYHEGLDKEILMNTIKASDPKNAFLMIVDDVCQGILFGMRFKHPITGKDIFQEIIWYVNKSFRGRGIALFEEVKKLLKYNGVSVMIMAVLENSKTEKLKTFYEALGFKKMETHYVRAI